MIEHRRVDRAVERRGKIRERPRLRGGVPGDPAADAFGAVVLAMSTSTGLVRATSGATVVPNDGQFHHVAGTYDGSVMKVYLDGVLVGQANRSGAIVATISAASSAGIPRTRLTGTAAKAATSPRRVSPARDT